MGTGDKESRTNRTSNGYDIITTIDLGLQDT